MTLTMLAKHHNLMLTLSTNFCIELFNTFSINLNITALLFFPIYNSYFSEKRKKNHNRDFSCIFKKFFSKVVGSNPSFLHRFHSLFTHPSINNMKGSNSVGKKSFCLSLFSFFFWERIWGIFKVSLKIFSP